VRQRGPLRITPLYVLHSDCRSARTAECPAVGPRTILRHHALRFDGYGDAERLYASRAVRSRFADGNARGVKLPDDRSASNRRAAMLVAGTEPTVPRQHLRHANASFIKIVARGTAGQWALLLRNPLNPARSKNWATPDSKSKPSRPPCANGW